MLSDSLRVWLRWGVSALLALASVFFLLSGFSTAVLGQGAEPGQMREAWNHQAAFRLCLAMLTWVGCVLVLITLRLGGFAGVIRGKKINRFKRWLYVGGLMAALAAFILSDPRVLITRIEIHRCTRDGGSWNYLARTCRF